jgi:hypothetical protein
VENYVYTKSTYFNYGESYDEKCKFPIVYFSELKLHESGNYFENRRISIYLNGKIHLCDDNNYPDERRHGWYPYPNKSEITKQQFLYEDTITKEAFESYWDQLKTSSQRS